MESTDRHRVSKKWVAFAALVFVAVVYTLSSLSSYIALPWSLNATVEDSISEAYSEKGGVISDKSYGRAIFLNEKGEVVTVQESQLLISPTTFYQRVAADETGVYLTEFTFIDDTEYVGTEQLVKYDFDGKRIGVLFEVTHDLGDNRSVLSSIRDLKLTQDGCFITLVNYVGNDVKVVKVPLESDAGDAVAVAEASGALPDKSRVIAASYAPENNLIYVVSALGDVYSCAGGKGAHSSFAGPLDQASTGVGVAGAITFGDGSAKEGETISFAPSLIARTLAFWGCVAFLTIALIALLVRTVVRDVRAKNFSSIRVVGGCVLALLLVVGIVLYYSYSILDSRNSDANVVTLTSVDTVAVCSNDELAKASLEAQEHGALSAATYNRLFEKLEACEVAQARYGAGVEFYYIAANASGEPVYLVDSNHSYISGSPVPFFAEINGRASTFDEVVSRLAYGSVIESMGTNISFSKVFDAEGNVVGLLATSSMVASHNAFVVGDIIKLFVALLDVLVALSFLILEGRSWVECFAERRRMRSDGAERPEMALGRPLNYLTMGALAVDGALLPLITQDMLAGTSLAGNGLAIAVPPLAYTLGLLAGVPLQVFLAKRLSARRYLLVCAAFATAFFVACGISVMMGSLVLLTLFIFLSHASIQVVASYVTTLPLNAKDGAQRSTMNRSYAAANVSATALSTLLAGNVADLAGNPYVFAVGGAFTALVIVFVFLFIRGGSAEKVEVPAKQNQGEKPVRAWGVLRDPHIFVLLVCMVMCGSMATGYKSYIFPLLAADAGLSKAVIASIAVYCNAFVFYINPAMARLEGQMGARNMLLIAGGAVSVSLLLFLVNGSLSWAIAVLVVIFIAGKTIEPAFATFWQERIVKTGISKDVAFPTIMLANNGLCLLRNPLLGVVLNVAGIALISPVVGAYCAVNTIVFFAVTRKKQ